MKKYKAIIVDDEVKLQEVLRIKLDRFCPNIKLVGIAANVPEAFQLIQEQDPTIVFLDIAMPKESGFDLLQRFESIHFEIIFVTGFDEYALDALKLSAVDYLLKPVDTKELQKAVEKAIVNIQNRQKIERYEVLKHNLNSSDEMDKKISIPNSNSHIFVHASEIIRCEGWNKYTKIYLQSGECIVSSYNIGTFKDLLEPHGFYTPHRSHVINPNEIQQYFNTGKVVLNDGSEIPIARRNKEEFQKRFIHKLKPL